MLKYVDTMVVMAEVPDEITLAINISGCPCKCKGCHSPWLWKDSGDILNKESLLSLIKDNNGITCVAFMGGDGDVEYLANLFREVRKLGLKAAWYSGRDTLPEPSIYKCLNYLKIGSYIEELGGLDKVTTNQKFYRINSADGGLENITEVFQKYQII